MDEDRMKGAATNAKGGARSTIGRAKDTMRDKLGR